MTITSKIAIKIITTMLQAATTPPTRPAFTWVPTKDACKRLGSKKDTIHQLVVSTAITYKTIPTTNVVKVTLHDNG